jgi:hypothetical protein
MVATTACMESIIVIVHVFYYGSNGVPPVLMSVDSAVSVSSEYVTFCAWALRLISGVIAACDLKDNLKPCKNSTSNGCS